MIKTATSFLQPSTRLIALIFLSLLTTGVHSANQKLITDDGREVLLKDDGGWVFYSTDRFANTDDGRRVRLKQDGSWHYIKSPPSKSRAKTQNSNPAIKLEKVVVEKYKKKALKNTRVKTRTVFYLQLKNTPQEKPEPTSKNSDISLIEVKDNNGKSYPLISIKTDATGIVIVRTEKSPSILDDVKSMQITLKAGIFGLKDPMTLNQKIVDFDEVNVDSFE